MDKLFKILVINPGSTSTKLSVFHNDVDVWKKNISHSVEELSVFPTLMDQYAYRKDLIMHSLLEEGINFEFDAIIGRGGLSKFLTGGVYEVNEKMVEDNRCAVFQHACNLGSVLAWVLSKDLSDCLPLIADPACVDEMCPEARISGSPLLPRLSIWHALNQRAIARKFSKEQGTTYSRLNLIIAHMGGGISVTAHSQGKAIDTNNALDGEGPFSPERAGTLPAASLIRLCFSGKFSEKELLKKTCGSAGLIAHLGTNNMKEILQNIENGDEHAKLVVDAMIYHTAKSIAAQSAVLYGKVDAILITGGLVYADYIREKLVNRLSFLAPIYFYPGEDEMNALASNALSVLRGETIAQSYT